MSRRVVRTTTVVVMAVLTLLLASMVIGHPPWAGRVVVVFSPGHGLHEGDLWAAAAWAVGAVLCGVAWATTRPASAGAG